MEEPSALNELTDSPGAIVSKSQQSTQQAKTEAELGPQPAQSQPAAQSQPPAQKPVARQPPRRLTPAESPHRNPLV